GDCAEAILQKIIGRSFFVQQSGRDWISMNYMFAAAEGPRARKAAETWWAEFQKKGEKQAVIDAVTSGGDDAPTQGEFLRQRYPEIATATLIQGAKSASNGSVRAKLIEQISQLGEAQGLEFLKDEMLHGPFLASHLQAASGLWRLGDRGALTAMMNEWEKGPERTSEIDS